jgi:hypothetical protein
MDYIRKIANSDILENIINLPENLRHKRVEIIILPCPETEDATVIPCGSDFKNKPEKNHHSKSNRSTEPAWLESAREYYENR